MKPSIATTLFAALLACTSVAAAQSFERAGTGIAPVRSGTVATGDLDRDGDLDVVLVGREPDTGAPVARLYRNDAGSFTAVSATLPGSSNATLDFGDYDGDGDLDLLLMGDAAADVFRNDGDFVFTPLGLGLPRVKSLGILVEVINTASAAWGDYDNDGDLDILLSGGLSGQNVLAPTLLLRNDEGAFVPQMASGFDALEGGSVEWGDVDNDGDLDVLATSRPGPSVGVSATTIYRNDGERFTALNTDLPGPGFGSARWGDFDNDGFLDVLLARATGTEETTEVFRNLRDNRGFAAVEAGLPNANYGAWLDFDHDGRRDVLLNRSTAGKRGAVALDLYRNLDAEGGFADAGANLEGVWFGSIATADLDGDRTLDILAAGQLTDDDGTLLDEAVLYYRNTALANAAPTPPHNLRSTFNQDDLVLEWDAATDPGNPSAALTYNVRVGTAPGAEDVVPAMALETGERLIPAAGNAGYRTRLVVRGLDPAQTYYWSVQAVDAAFAASPFAADRGTAVSGADAGNEMPEAPALLGNYPNPFNPGTTIRYALPASAPVRVTVYNMLGREIATLVDGVRPAGAHEVYWDGRDALGRTVPSGLYLYRLETPRQTSSRTMTLLK